MSASVVNGIDVTEYVWLVHYLAKRYRWAVENGACDYDDLYQVGMIGLMKAAELYDPSRGVEFATYARWRVLQKLGIETTGMGRAVAIPRLLAQQQREGIRDKTPLRGIPLDAPLFNGADGWQTTGKDMLVAVGNPEQDILDRDEVESRRRTAERLLGLLPERDADILRRRMKNETLEAIGAVYGICRERVRQIEARCLRTCRHSAQAREYREAM